MKLLFSLLLTLLATVLSAADTDAQSPYALPALRRHYQQAADSEDASRRFYGLLRNYTAHDAVVLAYKAASEAILAKHTGGLFEKLDRVKAASQQFDAAVALSPKHPEVRFLRFSIESNLPKFLGASQHLDEDRAFLQQALLRHPQSGLDAEGFRIVRDFMLAHHHIGGPEAARLRQLPE